jgi:hypothetical protein
MSNGAQTPVIIFKLTGRARKSRERATQTMRSRVDLKNVCAFPANANIVVSDRKFATLGYITNFARVYTITQYACMTSIEGEIECNDESNMQIRSHQGQLFDTRQAKTKLPFVRA